MGLAGADVSFLPARPCAQCIEMAAKVLRNLAAKGDPRGEFNSQGAIRPMVNLLRLSQENNDLENTRNVVTCMEHLSESPDNGCALRCAAAARCSPPSPPPFPSCRSLSARRCKAWDCRYALPSD